MNGQIRINEILACNASVNYDNTFNYEGWIELYNGNTFSVTLSGYYLSDDIFQLRKWPMPFTTIPAKGRILIWCDKTNTGLHSNFKLNPGGESLFLTNSSNIIIDSVSFGKQMLNVSYGRNPDGASKWSFFHTPTPLASNLGKTASLQAYKPEFNISGGFYSAPQTVIITPGRTSEKIYYTLNGSMPTLQSLEYKGPISVKDSVTVIRARAFGDTLLPGDIVTHTYFINKTHSLPVVSLTIDSVFLYDNMIGIYTEGLNGLTGNCVSYKANWNQDWARPANFEYFDQLKKNQINQMITTKISGACSRMYDQKSLAIHADKRYHTDRLNYQFFNSKSHLDNISVVLRNSGIDWDGSMLRDGFMQTIIANQMDIDYLCYQPSAVYLNGKYWGILNVRERKDEDYLWTNYHMDPDSIDELEYYMVVNKGSSLHYSNLIEYLKTHDITIQQNYNYVCTQMDVIEFINYYIAELYFSNTDWPGNNNKYWRPQRSDGKWRWILYDLDFGFGLWGRSPDFNMIQWITKTGVTSGANRDVFTFHFRTMLKNPVFKKEFINRFLVYLGSTFRPERVTHILDSCVNNILPEMPAHIKRWGGIYSYWKSDVSYMKYFGQVRPWYVYQHLQEYFGFGTPVPLILHSSINGGSFKMNDILINDTVFQGEYFQNSYLKITSVPPSGYKIKYWKAHFINVTDHYLFKKGSSWKYIDNGIAQPADWYTSTFDDSSWKTGIGQFGYGENDESTIVSYGPNASNKYITTYFRKKFNITDTSGMKDIILDLLIDDGAVVYLNGSPLFRVNMPTGVITYNTLATMVTDNYGVSYTLPYNLFKPGDNYLAVEVHQCAPNTSDLSFDCAVRYKKTGIAPPDTIYNSPFFADTMRYGMELTAYYEPDSITRIISINEVSALNSTLKDERGEKDDWVEIYNPGNDTVDIGGMYITDSAGCVTKHRFPSGTPQTKIPPKKHILLWADEQAYQGPLHMNFKLKSSGEKIIMSQKKGDAFTLSDSLVYIMQRDEYSFGRYPDGYTQLNYMYKTPGKPNHKGFCMDPNLSMIFINEISTINTSYENESGEFTDWFELYNSSDDTVDIGGIFMTDSLGDSIKHWMPFGNTKTRIPPKQFIVLSADKNPEKGPLHVDFKLSSKGEQLGLGYFKNFTWNWIDTLSYPSQLQGRTYGRYKDGNAAWIFMSNQSPWLNNIKDNTLSPDTIPGDTTIMLQQLTLLDCSAAPNPSSDIINIVIDKHDIHLLQIKIYNLNGTEVINGQLREAETQYNIQHLPAGMYIIKITGNGRSCQLKVLKE